MENSIEKDIEIINNFIAYFNKNIQNGYKADLTVLGEEIEALEHILSDYKRVLKELKTQKPNVKNGTYIGDYEGLLKLEKEITKRENIIEQLRTELNSLQKENEELKHKVEGQKCVIETQGHNEEVYEKLVMKLEKENTELKEENEADYTTVYLKRGL